MESEARFLFGEILFCAAFFALGMVCAASGESVYDPVMGDSIHTHKIYCTTLKPFSDTKNAYADRWEHEFEDRLNFYEAPPG